MVNQLYRSTMLSKYGCYFYCPCLQTEKTNLEQLITLLWVIQVLCGSAWI